MEFTAESLAHLLGGKVEGDGKVRLHTFAKIEEGHEGALSFFANPKYERWVYDTASSAILVKDDFHPTQVVSATLIRVSDPYEAMARLMTIASETINRRPSGIEQPSFIADDVAIPSDAYIGAFAYIGAGATIGAGAAIYPQAYIGEGVVIGEGATVYAGAKIYARCRIGARCIIHAGAVIGADGFGFAPTADGYEKIPQLGIVEIGDDVEIGANTTIDRATMGRTIVERGVKLDNLIQIGHNVRIGAHTVMAAQSGVAGSTKVGTRCMIGGQVGLAGHITMGDGASIGAQSGASKDIPAHARYFGAPATDILSYGRREASISRIPALEAQLKALKEQLEALKSK